MSKWGCGNASRADAVRARKFREWQDRAKERLIDREIKRDSKEKKKALQAVKEREEHEE